MARSLERIHPLQSRLQKLRELPDCFQVTADPFLTMTVLRFQPGGPATNTVTAALGVRPPTQPDTWVQGPAGKIIWLGPEEWLVISDLAAMSTQETDLRAAVTPSGGAAVDVSGQRVTLTLRGRHIRDVLAKGCAVDLHPRVFRSGSSAQTTLGLAGIVLFAGDDPDELTVLVRQSFANYLADWLIDASAELRVA
jgi:sarcosine oxidase, subunit gamma